MARKIRGRFCEKKVLPKSAFDRRSFRWKKSGRAWIMTGCRRGHFRNGRCDNGLRAHVVLTRTNLECRVGEHAVRKGR